MSRRIMRTLIGAMSALGLGTILALSNGGSAGATITSQHCGCTSTTRGTTSTTHATTSTTAQNSTTTASVLGTTIDNSGGGNSSSGNSSSGDLSGAQVASADLTNNAQTAVLGNNLARTGVESGLAVLVGLVLLATGTVIRLWVRTSRTN